MNNKTRILSTVMLDKALVYNAGIDGIAIDAIPFIHTEAIKNEGLEEALKRLGRQRINAVFTSVNAVQSVAAMPEITNAEWSIYCIGNATKKEVLAHFDCATVKGTAHDAATLAPVIIKDGVEEVFFFCGDKRLDVLPYTLRENNIPVNEVVVYNTFKTPNEVKEQYDGILFFSPSAVGSFFSLNSIHSGTVLFAIGSTTAKALKERTGNKVITSQVPSKEGVIAEVTKYFQIPVPVSLQGQ
jgi:uroporphyrinogen-III synthase